MPAAHSASDWLWGLGPISSFTRLRGATTGRAGGGRRGRVGWEGFLGMQPACLWQGRQQSPARGCRPDTPGQVAGRSQRQGRQHSGSTSGGSTSGGSTGSSSGSGGGSKGRTCGVAWSFGGPPGRWGRRSSGCRRCKSAGQRPAGPHPAPPCRWAGGGRAATSDSPATGTHTDGGMHGGRHPCAVSCVLSLSWPAQTAHACATWRPAAAHLSVVPSGPTLPVCTPSSFLTSSQTCGGAGGRGEGCEAVAAHNAFWDGMRPLRDLHLLALLRGPRKVHRAPPGLCAAHGKLFAPPSCAALSCGSSCLFFCCYPHCP